MTSAKRALSNGRVAVNDLVQVILGWGVWLAVCGAGCQAPMPVASVPAPPARPVTNGSPPPERPVAATEIARVLPGGDVVRVFRLDWISPLEARELITPLLTEAAVVITIGDVAPGLRPGVDGGADGDAGVPLLVVRDRPRNVEAVARVLRRSE